MVHNVVVIVSHNPRIPVDSWVGTRDTTSSTCAGTAPVAEVHLSIVDPWMYHYIGHRPTCGSTKDIRCHKMATDGHEIAGDGMAQDT